MNTPTSSLSNVSLAFIGGGNMATAILSGLCKAGLSGASVTVVEPFTESRQRLEAEWGVRTLAAADASLQSANCVIWAVKPQVFAEACAPVAPHTPKALHLSVAAGIQTASISRWLNNPRVVRTMPNTPALIGQGMTGMFASNAVNESERILAETLLAPTGRCLWVAHESDLDAVTALSGSGPAYVFYFLEAMRQAGSELGLSPETAYALALQTFAGATALAAQSSESPEVLRERVTSKGGTTYAALQHMEAAGVKKAFVNAMHAAAKRAEELGKSL